MTRLYNILQLYPRHSSHYNTHILIINAHNGDYGAAAAGAAAQNARAAEATASCAAACAAEADPRERGLAKSCRVARRQARQSGPDIHWAT